ncbi:hypothetical protein BB561_001704 [Smittium simulii]|uniref:HMG box domain-containing protein n=1 Tax=Smittium simulii TaxID=133385 RepID=A0A2T9YTF4_9FUNG|nr:hypothetical protein BB561_001704 [Smittium simulii]
MFELPKIIEHKEVELEKVELKKAELKMTKLFLAKLANTEKRVNIKVRGLKNKLDQKQKDSLEKHQDTLEKLKLDKKLIASTGLVVPSFPSSPYRFYIYNEYQKLKNDPSTIVLHDIGKNILNMSANWKLKTEAEKIEYKQKWLILKKQFAAELHKWWDNVDKNLVKLENCHRKNINIILKDKGKHKLPMLVDPRAPKRPITAYAMYVKGLKESNNPKLPSRAIDFIKYVASKWKQLPESEKDIYRDKYSDAFKLYKEVSNKYK